MEEWKQRKGTKALVNTKGKRVDGVEFLVNKNREQNKARQRALVSLVLAHKTLLYCTDMTHVQ